MSGGLTWLQVAAASAVSGVVSAGVGYLLGMLPKKSASCGCKKKTPSGNGVGGEKAA
jgi:hypothetical protein